MTHLFVGREETWAGGRGLCYQRDVVEKVERGGAILLPSYASHFTPLCFVFDGDKSAL